MPDNAKDFVEHVRTVHFALLVTCTALIITVLSGQPGDVKEAVRELQTVKGLSELLKRPELRSLVTEVLKSQQSGLLDFGAKKSAELRVSIENKTPLRLWIRYQCVNLSSDLGKIVGKLVAGDEDVDELTSTEETSRKSGPASLDSFKKIWDLIASKPEAYVTSQIEGESARLVDREKDTDDSSGFEDAQHNPFTLDEIRRAKIVHVESIPTLSSGIVADIIDIASKETVSTVVANDVATEGNFIAALSSDDRYLFVLRPENDEGTRFEKCRALVFDLTAEKTGTDTPFLIDLERNMNKPRGAISPTGRNLGISSYHIERRNGVSFPTYLIRVFDRKNPGAGGLPKFLGRPPLAFVGEDNVLSAGFMGTGVSLTTLQPPTPSLSPTKIFFPELAPRELRVTPDGIRAVVVGNIAVGGALHGGIWSMDIHSGQAEVLQSFDNAVTAPKVSFSHNGNTVAVVADYKVERAKSFFRLYCWRWQNGGWTAIGQRDLESNAAIACSPTGDKIAIASHKNIHVFSGPDLATETMVSASKDTELIAFNSNATALICVFSGGGQTNGSLIEIADGKSEKQAFWKAPISDLTGSDADASKTRFLLLPVTISNQNLDGTRRYRLDLQAALRRKTGVADWRSGPFRTSFPALAEVPDHYGPLPFDQLEKVLKTEIPQSQQTVEAFGLKIPASELQKWGTLLILALETYFGRHLRFMRRAHLARIKESKSAWIGLYDDRLSRIGTFLTTVLLPVCACAVLVWIAARSDFETNHLRWWQWGFGVTGIVLSTYLAFGIAGQLRRLWAELAD